MRAVRVIAVATTVAILVLVALLSDDVVGAHAPNVVAAVAAVHRLLFAVERILRRRPKSKSGTERGEMHCFSPESTHTMQR